MTLTPAQLEQQLACLYCGILWEGTAEQVQGSVQVSEGNVAQAGTIKQQLAALDEEQALRVRRRFRKLWRQRAKRLGIDPSQVSRRSTRHFAYEEALRIYRECNEVNS